MNEIVTNDANLKEDDITEVIQRVKLLLIDDDYNILLDYIDNDYKFPDYEVLIKEELSDTINRVIHEEINTKVKRINKPFACLKEYYKNWPIEGNNRKTEVYYYGLNIGKNSYNNDVIKPMSINDVKERLECNAVIFGDKYAISKEILKYIKNVEGKINEE